jgi:predicted transposase/invertase (TIGR01784 family)
VFERYRYTLYAPETKSEFTDIIEVNTLELVKLPEVEDGSELWNWLKFLSARRKEDLDMIAERSPKVKKAVVRLMELSNDERTRLLYESRQKMEWDNQARERGAVKTREYEIARNALQKKMPIDDIVDITGLTREEIEGFQIIN